MGFYETNLHQNQNKKPGKTPQPTDFDRTDENGYSDTFRRDQTESTFKYSLDEQINMVSGVTCLSKHVNSKKYHNRMRVENYICLDQYKHVSPTNYFERKRNSQNSCCVSLMEKVEARERPKHASFDQCSSGLEFRMEAKPLEETDSEKLKKEIKRWAKAVVGYARELSGSFSSGEKPSSDS